MHTFLYLKCKQKLATKTPNTVPDSGKSGPTVPCSYRSLHTVVHVEEGVSVEVQIRTREMHYQAEYGLAAHWRYKEGDAEYPTSLQNMYDYQRWVLTFQAEVADTKCRVTPAAGSMQPPCPFPTHLKTCCYSEEHGKGLDALADSNCDPVYIVLFENDTVSDILDRSNCTI